MSWSFGGEVTHEAMSPPGHGTDLPMFFPCRDPSWLRQVALPTLEVRSL